METPNNRTNWRAVLAGINKAAVVGAAVVAFGLGYAVRWGCAPSQAKKPTGVPTTRRAAARTKWWTCSMHPAIKLPKPGLCPICNMKLIPLDVGETDAGSLRTLTVSDSARKLMEIQTAPVERKFVEARVRMVGKIDYDETRLKYITAWMSGRLDRLHVNYTGVPVKKGHHLAELYSPELISAQEELLQARETVKGLKESDISIVRETAEATVIAAREKLRLWGLKPEQIAAIEKRGKPTDHMTIYAPAGGIVVHKNAQEGMYVKTGTKIYTIADLSQVWIRLDAYESDLKWLRYGQKVELTVEAYPGEQFFGTVAFIDPILTQTTRTVKVRVNAPNPKLRLKPGMFVRATARAKVATAGKVMDAALAGKWICPMHPDVVKETAGKCDICEMPLARTESLGYVSVDPDKADKPLVIPATAVLWTGARAIVYVETPGKKKPTFEGREIVLGPRAGDYYLVRHGLAEGELVVTKGSFKIDAELQIRAKPSMMTPEGGGGDGEEQMKLPALVRTQLDAVLAAGAAVDEAVEGGEPGGVRAAFADLGHKVQAVDKHGLSGHVGLLWKEYAMLLGNDAVIGKEAKKPSEAKSTAKEMREHLASMKSKLGLSHGRQPTTAPTISAKFRRQFGKVVEGYLAMQRALAADKPTGAAAAANDALSRLQAVDMKLLGGDDHVAWMKHAGVLKKVLTDATKAGNIEAARTQFALLSEELAVAAKRFGVSGASLYQFKCPMVFNNRGATWLQADDKTRNPYFGGAMLGCGEVTDVLRAVKEDGGSHGR